MRARAFATVRGRRMAAVALAIAAGWLASPPAAAGPADAVTTATLVSATRLVRVRERPRGPVTPAKPGMALPEGSVVMTLKDARCQIKFGDGRLLSLAGNTSVEIARLPKRGAARALLRLVRGRVRAVVDRMVGEGDVGIYGATAVTAVKGTEWEVARDARDKVEVVVRDGRVSVAEIRSETLTDVETVFLMLILGRIGFEVAAGSMISVIPGTPFPATPVPIPPGMPNPFAPPGSSDADSSKDKKPGPPSLPGLPGLGGPF